MISREQATKQALYELELVREENYATERERDQRARAACTDIDRLVKERQSLFTLGVQKAFSDPENANDISNRLAADMDRINGELRRALVKNGFPEDYLQPVSRCDQCHDTGYVGDLVHELCSCVRQRMLKIMMSDEGLEDLEEQNFATFDADIFPDHPLPGRKSTQRQYMLKVKERLEKYADGFEKRNGQSVILAGASGLGKTFLMNCVAERVLTRGFTVIKISAYRLYNTLKNYQYNLSNEDLVGDLIRADLLAIDDLGTEPVTKANNEQSGLYHIVNERISSGGPMIITTNLDADGTRERYGDRISSRLYDASRVSVYELSGEDVRRFAKR